jgi:hypothetical protein
MMLTEAPENWDAQADRESSCYPLRSVGAVWLRQPAGPTYGPVGTRWPLLDIVASTFGELPNGRRRSGVSWAVSGRRGRGLAPDDSWLAEPIQTSGPATLPALTEHMSTPALKDSTG